MPWRRWIASAGITSAASASPLRTFSIASARVLTRIGSTASKNRDVYVVASRLWPPRLNVASPARFANATRGFSGPPVSAAPIRTATTTG
jgi:hypothetical protein